MSGLGIQPLDLTVNIASAKYSNRPSIVPQSVTSMENADLEAISPILRKEGGCVLEVKYSTYRVAQYIGNVG